MWKEPQLESRRRAHDAKAGRLRLQPRYSVSSRSRAAGSRQPVGPASDFRMPGAPFTWTELGLEPRDRIRRREHLAFIFTFSATFEICRDDRICRQGNAGNVDESGIP